MKYLIKIPKLQNSGKQRQQNHRIPRNYISFQFAFSFANMLKQHTLKISLITNCNYCCGGRNLN